MHYINMKLILIAGFVGIIASGNSIAAESIEIVKASGSVVVRQDNQKERSVGLKSILPAKHILVTGPNGRAVVRIGDAGYIVVEKNSTIEVDRVKDHANFFRQVTGMIYYAMNTLRPSQPPIEVRMSAATIGIRGTRFLVADVPERKEIGMRKGLVSVSSTDGDFEIHRQAQEDEFAAFKREGQEAVDEEKRKFSEYKANAAREFIEYKHEFGLEKDRMATFDGNRVEERLLSDESRKDMETLESYGKEWLDEVHD
jgi:hypothetical protein